MAASDEMTPKPGVFRRSRENFFSRLRHTATSTGGRRSTVKAGRRLWANTSRLLGSPCSPTGFAAPARHRAAPRSPAATGQGPFAGQQDCQPCSPAKSITYAVMAKNTPKVARQNTPSGKLAPAFTTNE